MENCCYKCFFWGVDGQQKTVWLTRGTVFALGAIHMLTQEALDRSLAQEQEKGN